MTKLKDLKKRGISLVTAAFTVVSLAGCNHVKGEPVETISISTGETNNDKFDETIYFEEVVPVETTAYVEETMPVETTAYVEETMPKDYPKGFTYVSQNGNEFNNYCKTVIVNGQETVAYSGYNVILAIDEKTYEVKEYIYNKGAVTEKVYDLETGYLVVDGDLISFSTDDDVKNWEKITEGNYIFDFAYIDSYLENPEYKEWYTLEEIRELELVMIDVIKSMVNDNSKTK